MSLTNWPCFVSPIKIFLSFTETMSHVYLCGKKLVHVCADWQTKQWQQPRGRVEQSDRHWHVPSCGDITRAVRGGWHDSRITTTLSHSYRIPKHSTTGWNTLSCHALPNLLDTSSESQQEWEQNNNGDNAPKERDIYSVCSYIYVHRLYTHPPNRF